MGFFRTLGKYALSRIAPPQLQSKTHVQAARLILNIFVNSTTFFSVKARANFIFHNDIPGSVSSFG
jgi:hypothetical protein